MTMTIPERQVARTIWTLATSTDSGISSQAFQTEHEAFEALANIWFPNFDLRSGGNEDRSNHAAMLAALSESVAAAREWFEDFQMTEEAFGDAAIESHEIWHPPSDD